MRLIDADALPKPRLEGYADPKTDKPVYDKATIDAAPTVSCEECALRRTCLIPEYAIAGPAFGCSYFERRTP